MGDTFYICSHSGGVAMASSSYFTGHIFYRFFIIYGHLMEKVESKLLQSRRFQLTGSTRYILDQICRAAHIPNYGIYSYYSFVNLVLFENVGSSDWNYTPLSTLIAFCFKLSDIVAVLRRYEPLMLF